VLNWELQEHGIDGCCIEDIGRMWENGDMELGRVGLDEAGEHFQLACTVQFFTEFWLVFTAPQCHN
jgi:hypothetical protein